MNTVAAADGPSRRRSHASGSLFPPFAGVALADILANSAAIVIIMIVVTLMARREEEEQKLEQAEEVAVLLSRELATSFVMNALPTSAPARLHDYVTYPPDRNPQHAEMPIVELHAGYLRDYYTGRVYTRDELLRHDNAFDAYLGGLAFEQLQAVRIDVYSITEFYIAMSILKAHGVQPRHWHFLAEGSDRAVRGGDAVGVLAERLRRDRPAFEPTDGWPGLGSSTRGSRSEDSRPGSALPTDVELAAVGRGTEAYPRDGLGRGTAPDGPAGGTEETLDLPPSGPGDPAPGASTTPGDPGGQAGGTSSVRFRTAQPATLEGQAEWDFDLPTVLRGLFAFMRSVQADVDGGRPSGLAGFDFVRDVLARAEEPLPDRDERLVGTLVQEMSEPAEEENPNLVLVHRIAQAWRGQALGVPVNRPLYLVHWLRGPAQGEVSGEVETDVTLRLGLHAAIYRGLRVPLGRDGYVLMPPVAEPDPEPRWRVVTLVSARVDDFVTGFVYAAVDEDGRLRLPVDENAVEIGGVGVESVYPSVSLRGERRQLVFYGLIAALFAIGVVIRIWRRA